MTWLFYILPIINSTYKVFVRENKNQIKSLEGKEYDIFSRLC